MATYKTVITLTHSEPPATLKERLYVQKGKDPHVVATKISSYFAGLSAGMHRADIDIQEGEGDAVAAQGTLTLSSSVATDTVVINGVTLTEVASGAASSQFNHGATDTLTAANLAAAINASTNPLIQGHVTASASGAVVTLSHAVKGLHGNAVTLSATGGITASGARLAGGSNASANSFKRS